MGRGSSGREDRTGRRQPRAARRLFGGTDAGEPELLGAVRDVLEADDPLPLLVLGSSLLASVDRGPSFGQRDDEGPTLQEIFDSFVEVPRIETTALLAAFAELVADEVLARRIRRELDGRDHRMPAWLGGLAPLQVDRALAATHVLGDMDIVVVEARTAGGAVFTCTVYVDHDLGTVATDGFCYAGPADAVVEQLGGSDDPDLDVSEIAPADGRARIAEAVETGRITYPPYETDTWPGCRALVEWVLRAMPEGGAGHARPEVGEDERVEIAERFFDSPYGRGHDHPDGHDLLESLLWYGCDYGTGDPLTWSETAVWILLADWLPRKVVAGVDLLGLAPDLLRSFIRFGHEVRGIRDELTAVALETVDELAPEYQRVIRTVRPQGPAALLAAMGVLDEDEAAAGGPFGGLSPHPWANIYRDVLERLRRAVGGDEALDALDVEPLPDETFDRDRIAEDIRGKVIDVLDLLDRCAEEVLDVEYRTAFRRLLADVAAADPEVFRRRGRTDTAAAAIAWIVGKANDLFDSYGDGLSIGELTGWFGVASSPSQRAGTMLRALGLDDDTYAGVQLGTPRYLVSGRRRQIIARRDQARRSLAGNDGPPVARPSGDPAADGAPWDDEVWTDELEDDGPWISNPWEDLVLGVDPAPALPWSTADPIDVLAVGWFPPDAFAEAVDRWPGLADRVGSVDYAAYARIVQGTLMDLSRDFGQRPVLVALDVDELAGFADAMGLDPADRRTRAAMAVEVADSGGTRPWPPGRNDLCWCGSGRKYKRCCDTVPADPARRGDPETVSSVQAFELDVTLEGARPPVWRRLRIAADGTFADLHGAIQHACGWSDYHLFAFSTPDGRVVAGSGFDDGFGTPEPDAADVPLVSYFARNDRCRYEYDFGDGWIHDIRLRDRITGPVGYRRQLVDGQRAFPPEDCGGMPGYEQCVQAATGGPDPGGVADWLGDWHPEHFDLEQVRLRFDK